MDVKVFISLYPRFSSSRAMISQTAEYALRAIVFLARHPDAPQTRTQIADATCVPSGYLAKVMQNLARVGLVHSQRGLNGGFVLAHLPDDVSVLDVINAVDPIRRFPECPLGIKNHGRRLCPLHHRLDGVAQAAEDSLARTKVAELLGVVGARKPSCRFPAGSGVAT